jgi:hypothetical protein
MEANFVGCLLIEEHNGYLRYMLPASSLETIPRAFKILEASKTRVQVEDYELSQTTLEAIFCKLATEQLAEDDEQRRGRATQRPSMLRRLVKYLCPSCLPSSELPINNLSANTSPTATANTTTSSEHNDDPVSAAQAHWQDMVSINTSPTAAHTTLLDLVQTRPISANSSLSLNTYGSPQLRNMCVSPLPLESLRDSTILEDTDDNLVSYA